MILDRNNHEAWGGERYPDANSRERAAGGVSLGAAPSVIFCASERLSLKTALRVLKAARPAIGGYPSSFLLISARGVKGRVLPFLLLLFA